MFFTLSLKIIIQQFIPWRLLCSEVFVLSLVIFNSADVEQIPIDNVQVSSSRNVLILNTSSCLKGVTENWRTI